MNKTCKLIDEDWNITEFFQVYIVLQYINMTVKNWMFNNGRPSFSLTKKNLCTLMNITTSVSHLSFIDLIIQYMHFDPICLTLLENTFYRIFLMCVKGAH